MEEHRDIKIGIDKEKSPEYFTFFDKSNYLMDSYDSMFKKMRIMNLSKIWPFKNSRLIRNLIKEYSILEKPFREWNRLATKILYSPKL